MSDSPSPIARRFRGFLPAVVDVECGGFNAATDALLEIAVVLVDIDADGNLVRGATHAAHVEPFPGANIEQAALDITGIKVDHPLRLALHICFALQNTSRAFNAVYRTCTPAAELAISRYLSEGAALASDVTRARPASRSSRSMAAVTRASGRRPSQRFISSLHKVCGAPRANW